MAKVMGLPQVFSDKISRKSRQVLSINERLDSMANSKFYNTATILDEDQVKDLLHFMRLPSNLLSDRDQQIMSDFFEKLQDEEVYNEEAVWQTITQEGDNSMKQMKSRLLKTLERYLIFHAVDRAPALKNVILSEVYVENLKLKNASSAINKATKLVETLQNRDLRNELYKFWLFELEVNSLRDERRTMDQIDQMEAALKEFFAIHSMRLLCEKVNRRNIIQEFQDLPQAADQILEMGKSTELKIYHQVFKMLVSKDRAAFEYIRNFLDENEQFFAPKFLKELLEYLTNFCIENINSGDPNFAKTYLRYIEQMEKNNLLLDGGKISVLKFTNCVVASIIAQKYDWIGKFIGKYADCVPIQDPEEKKALIAFNKAIVALHAGDVDQSAQFLTTFQASAQNNRDLYYKVAGDKMLLKIRFEKGDYKFVETRTESVDRYIRRTNALKKERKKKHQTFLKLLRKLRKHTPFDLDAHKEQLYILDYLWLAKFS